METAYFDQTSKKGLLFMTPILTLIAQQIYATLNKLSDASLQFLKTADLKEFSFATDRMRPLMAYINDNNVLISKHLEDDGDTKKTNKAAIQEFASNLTQNLKTISKVQETMNEIEFSPVFFLSNLNECLS